MQFETSGYWKPRAYRCDDAPTLTGLQTLLLNLQPRVSRSTYEMFKGLTQLPPAQRAAKAIQTAMSSLLEYPEVVEDSGLTTAEVFARLLSAEEYASFLEIAGCRDLLQIHKKTAEELLCLKDRGTVVHFFSLRFAVLRNQPYIHPLDGVQED